MTSVHAQDLNFVETKRTLLIFKMLTTLLVSSLMFIKETLKHCLQRLGIRTRELSLWVRPNRATLQLNILKCLRIKWLIKRPFHQTSRSICSSDDFKVTTPKFKKSTNILLSNILSFYNFSLIYSYQNLLAKLSLIIHRKCVVNWNHHHKFSRSTVKAAKGRI